MTEKLLAEAIAFAAEKHAEQKRKDGTPYIYHPFRVAEFVRANGYGVPYQITAILHDTLEDTDATEEEIRIFGEDVLEAVRLLTRPEGTEETDYVRAILENEMAAVVKAADKIDNLTDVILLDGVGNQRTPKNIKKAERYIQKAKDHYYGKFSEALDYVIGTAESQMHYADVCPRIQLGGIDVRLYTEREREDYRIRKEQYPTEEKPIMQDMRFCADDFGEMTYYCYGPDRRFWMLTRSGWQKISGDPILEDEYGTYIHMLDQEDMKEVIQGMEFYDFVEKEKLLGLFFICTKFGHITSR